MTEINYPIVLKSKLINKILSWIAFISLNIYIFYSIFILEKISAFWIIDYLIGEALFFYWLLMFNTKIIIYKDYFIINKLFLNRKIYLNNINKINYNMFFGYIELKDEKKVYADPDLIEAINNKNFKVKDKKELYKIKSKVSNILFIITLLSIILPFIISYIISLIFNIFGFYYHLCISITFFIFAFICFLSILLGIDYYLKYNVHSVKNIVLGIIMLPITIIMAIIFTPKNSLIDYEYINEVENIIKFNLPDAGIAETNSVASDYYNLDNWQTDSEREYPYVSVYFKTKSEIAMLSKEIKESNLWINNTESYFKELGINNGKFKYSSNKYYLLYYDELGKYNIVPEENGEYSIYFLTYDINYPNHLTISRIIYKKSFN